MRQHGFTRVGVACPRLYLGDPLANARETISLLRQAARERASVVVFPELGITGYS
ncbi:MAG: nitrilase-related carbon-nitrogen hydrolase, partial [Planctomycetota bacterium]